MIQKDVLTALTLLCSGPIGWAVSGLFLSEKLRRLYCESKRQKKEERLQLMYLMVINDGEEIVLKFPLKERKLYEERLEFIMYRLKSYRSCYKDKTDEEIMRYTAIDLATDRQPVDFRARQYITLDFCGQQISINVKKENLQSYKRLAKHLTRRYNEIRDKYGEEITDKQAMFLLMMDTDICRFHGAA